MAEAENEGRVHHTEARKVGLAAAIGTTIEWYDYFIYGNAAALVFGQLFFPEFSPVIGTLAALSTFAVAFFARPIGGAICGHLGDKIGRKVMLVATLLVIGLATFFIGLLPTYQAIGVWAPILLITLRLVQGLAVGGEWGGAALMCVEHSPREKRGFYGSFPQVGVPAGIILANLVFIGMTTALSTEEFLAWGWRVPFLLSIVLVVVGLIIRLTVQESPLFARVKESRGEARMPIADVFRTQPKEVFKGAGAFIANHALAYLVMVYMLSYSTQVLGFAYNVALTIVLLAAVVQIFATVGSAALSDRVGRQKVFWGGAILGALWAFPLFWLTETRSAVLAFIAFTVANISVSAMSGPQAAYFSEMFRTRIRYTGASMGYQIGSIFGGGLAPVIAAALFAATGGTAAISAYIVVICVISFISMALIGETFRTDLGADVRAGEEDLIAGVGTATARGQI